MQGATFGFDVAAYDRSLPLIIDPTLNYTATVGRGANDKVNAIAVGADGSTYVAGVSPASTAADQDQAFVAHISADGKTLLYLTYLGGATGSTDARAIALDAGGDAYITGETKAADFPVLNALFGTCSLNEAKQCAGDAYLAKVNADGSLNFATYLGGTGEDAGNAIALDATGDIYIAGSTASTNFPAFAAVQPTTGGAGDAFVAKLSANGLHVLYATFLGGTGADEALAIAVDANQSAYITGQTKSVDFPVKAPFQAECRLGSAGQCAGEAFVTKLSPDGSQIDYSTYLGGTGGDVANSIALDSAGHVFIAGATSSRDFPTAHALQAKLKGTSQAFVAELLADGSGLVYSTYLGGSGADVANSIAIDKTGKVFIAGHTSSPDFPTQGSVQSQCTKSSTGACSTDAFLAVLNASGTGLQFSTYLGGSGADDGRGIALDSKGAAYLGGATPTLDFPKAEAAVLEPGMSPASPGPFGAAARAAGAAVTKPLAVPAGGVVAKISGITPQTGCSINWTGGGGNNQWTTAANWDKNLLPATTDDVCIGTELFFKHHHDRRNFDSRQSNDDSLVSNANISFTSALLPLRTGQCLRRRCRLRVARLRSMAALAAVSAALQHSPVQS